jgi:hypothetical protein
MILDEPKLTEKEENTVDEIKKIDNSDTENSFANSLDEVENWHGLAKSEEPESPEYKTKNDNERKYVNDSENESLSSVNSLDAVENWRGKGNSNESVLINIKNKDVKKRRTTYMEPYPEIERLIEKKYTRSASNTLILNGNMCTPLKIEKNKFLVYNTCPFDAVAMIIAMAYLDIPSYNIFINSNKNEMLLFCKSLALHGSNKKTYIDRFKILRPHFEESNNLSNIKVLDTRCNALYIVTKLLTNAPSAIENINCSNMNCDNFEKQDASPTIILRIKNFTGFGSIEEILKEYVATKKRNCYKCNGTINLNRTLMQHLFIETDMYSESDHLFSL